MFTFSMTGADELAKQLRALGSATSTKVGLDAVQRQMAALVEREKPQPQKSARPRRVRDAANHEPPTSQVN